MHHQELRKAGNAGPVDGPTAAPHPPERARGGVPRGPWAAGVPPAESSPPHPRIALRVGVTGHRPNRLSDADGNRLRPQVRRVLGHLRETAEHVRAVAGEAYAAAPPLLRVITPLAEGADRLVAEEALAMGFEIQCPLPFAREVYERDFVDMASRAAFHRLLAQASAVLELAGEHDPEGVRREAYQGVGRLLLAQSDVLIAIWGGDNPAGTGGTGQVVAEAIREGLPTVWLHPRAPCDLRLFLPEDATDAGPGAGDPTLARLGAALEKRLLPPEPPPDAARIAPAGRLWGQRRLSVYALFCRLLAGGARALAATPAEVFGEPPVPEADSRLPAPLAAQIDQHFLAHFRWADRLAAHYAERYRSSFVLNYLLSALAVLCSLLGYALGLPQEAWGPFIVGELALICLIIAITTVGAQRRWHTYWMDLRLLAERLRQTRFLLPLGLSPAAMSVPGHHRHGDPQNSWGSWQLEAALRAAGLLSLRIDAPFLAAYARFLARRELRAQAAYHSHNAARCARIAHRLEIASYSLFVLTLLACVAHLQIHDAAGRWLTFAAAGLPAFGAAFAGILNQGEFQRIAHRSEAMHEHLSQLSERIEACQDASLAQLVDIAREAADTMSGELLDWRIIFLKRRLALPS